MSAYRVRERRLLPAHTHHQPPQDGAGDVHGFHKHLPKLRLERIEREAGA